MGDGKVRVRDYYRKCLENGCIAMPDREKDLVGNFFNEKIIYGDYNGKSLFEGQDGEIDEAQIVKYALDENKFSFLKGNGDYNAYMKKREAFFGRLEKCRDEGTMTSVLNESAVDAYLDAYQNLLVSSMRILSECEEELEKAEIRHFLDIYLLIDCVRSNHEKAIYVSWIHPVMLLHIKKIIKDESLPKGDSDGFIDELERRIAAMLLAKEMPKRLYSSTAIYTVDKNRCLLEKDGVMAARQIRSMSTLNNIDSIRILEKVLAAWEQKKEKSADKIELKIAYFGEFSDAPPAGQPDGKDGGRGLNIENYLNLAAVREEHGLGESSFRFVHFRLVDPGVTDFYQSDHGEEYYNLQEMGHLENLFRNYDMAFFLDQGYYYRKAFLERRESFKSACEFHNYVSQFMKEENKLEFRQTLLLFWMKWGFRYLGDKSGEYEFGKNLHNNIRLRPEQDSCNVYAYISESRKVGDFNLEASNVCRGEFYYGDKIIVSHFSNRNDIDITSLIEPDNLPQNDPSRYVIYLNAWRMFKILYDRAFDLLYMRWRGYLKEEGDKKGNISVVYLLQNVWIGWNFSNMVLGDGGKHAKNLDLKLIFNKEKIGVISSGSMDVMEKELREYIERIFCMAFSGGKEMVREYTRQVIIETVKGACRKLEDFLFAHYLKYCYEDYTISCKYGEMNESIKGNKSKKESQYGNKELSVQTRQAVHAVIKKMDNMHLRIVENRGRYIKQDMIRECCEGVGEADFDKLLERMKELFTLGFRNKDLLAHNIDILC